MGNKKNIIITLAYVLIMALFFMLGFWLGKANNIIPVVSKPIPTEPLMKASLPAYVEERTGYSVKVDDSKLFLSRVDGDNEEVLYSIEISESIYPKEDIEELKKGIYFESIEDAHTLIENFAS